MNAAEIQTAPGYDPVTGRDDRPKRYVETLPDGSERVIYRASSLGTCDRAVVASARGHWPAEPTPDWLQEVFDEGTAAEPIVSGKYDAMVGRPTFDQQLEVELFIGEVDGREVYIRGHIDGLAVAKADDPEGPQVLREYKKFRDSTWHKFVTQGIECNPNYPWQVSFLMHGLGVDDCEFVGGRCSGWTEDSDGNAIPNIVEILCKPVHGPPLPLKAIRKKIMALERLCTGPLDPSEIPCADPADYPCPFFKFHDEKDEATDEAVVLPTDDVAQLVVDKFVAADREIKRLKALLKPHEDAKKQAKEGLLGLIEMAGDEAAHAKRVAVGGATFKRTVSHYPEKVRAAYTTDAIALVAPTDKDI